MVHVNGDLTTCCLDERLENRLGNVNETPLRELWNGPTLRAWRLAHATGEFAASGPYCTRCNWRSAGAMADAELEGWLAAEGEAIALERYRRRRGRT
jgi:radical SAM protein with 4Fe4S-binding SPASM domain